MSGDETRGARSAGRVVVGLTLGLYLWLGILASAFAQCAGVPNCEVQDQAGFKIKMEGIHRQTFTCTGGHPFVWNYIHTWSGDIPVGSL